MSRAVALALGLALMIGGCEETTTTYCDGDHPCRQDSSRPRCDFATRTCMTADDAGVPDGPGQDGAPDAGCTASGQCTTPTTPICAQGACRGCENGGECASRDPATPACADDGRCVECVASAECSVATAPICAAETCRACQTGAECAARNAATPACHADGSCVECRASTDCATKLDTPVCDLATSTCVPCTADEQCSHFCELGTGRCVMDSDIIFVDALGPSCPSPGPGTGTLADPYCEIANAVANLGMRRYIHVAPGTYSQRVNAQGTSFRLRAEQGAKLVALAPFLPAILVGSATVDLNGLTLGGTGTTADYGVSVNSGGALTLRHALVTAHLKVGVNCTNGALTMDGVEVTSHPQGGLFLSGCTSTIANSVIARNGTAGSSGSPFGGIRIASPGAGSSFVNNTVVFNSAIDGLVAGVRCDTAAQLVNSVMWSNSPSQVGSGCVAIYSNIGPEVVGGQGNLNQAPYFANAASNDFHLLGGSPGIDAASGSGAPDHDFDGYPRAYGSAPDMGAFEWHP